MFPILWSVFLYSAFALGRWARRAPSRGRSTLYRALIWLSMAGQLLCLSNSGLLVPQTALPLHLCSFSGVLSLFRGKGVTRFLNRLGRVGAALALLFPAPLQTNVPLLSDGLFCLTHALLLFLPLERREGGAFTAALLALALVLLAYAADMRLDANYLFLRRFPIGVPEAVNGWTPFTRAIAALGLMLIILIPDGSIIKGGKIDK